jgi:hypothetical protein
MLGDTVVHIYDLFNQRPHITVILTGVAVHHLHRSLVLIYGSVKAPVDVDEEAQDGDERDGRETAGEVENSSPDIGVGVLVNEPTGNEADDCKSRK